MEGRILLHRRGLERITILEGVDRLVLGAVIFVNPMNIAPQRNSPDKEQEQGDANDAVHQVENNLLAKHRVHPFQFGGRHEGRNLYMKMKKPTEMMMLTAAIQP